MPSGDRGELGIGMVGYAFMGRAHSQAWRTVGHFFDLPLTPRMAAICGRDEADPTAPTFDQVMNQLTEDRVNLRARRYLRDLRRDAVIEFR